MTYNFHTTTVSQQQMEIISGTRFAELVKRKQSTHREIYEPENFSPTQFEAEI